MNQIVYIEGMTCQSCVGKVKALFERESSVDKAEVYLEENKVVLYGSDQLPIHRIEALLLPYPKYKLTNTTVKTVSKSKLQTFKPLILVFLFITLVSVVAAMKPSGFSFADWMNYFMAGFFIVFSFFKFLDLPNFASSFQMYDLLAKKSRFYALSYPFLELGLGLAYLTDFQPKFTNWVTLIVMGFGTLGVVQSVRSKTKIRCACLGSVWNLPMTTVTIVENMLMVLMAAYGLVILN